MNQDPYIIENPPKQQPVSAIKTYAVTLKTTITGVKKPVNSVINYTLEIDFNNHFFTLKKKNVLINNQKINSKVNELYLKTAAPLNTLEIKCTEQGTIKELYKHNDLLKHWQATKTIIEHEFKGDFVTQLLTHLDEVYENKQYIVNQLNSNVVLETFYRSFLNDYLIYYGKNNISFTKNTVLNKVPIPFSGYQKLKLKDTQLYLQTNVKLNKTIVNKEPIENYFKDIVTDFSIDDLEITLKDQTLLDYESTWIKKSTVTKKVQLKNYRKEIELILLHIK